MKVRSIPQHECSYTLTIHWCFVEASPSTPRPFRNPPRSPPKNTTTTPASQTFDYIIVGAGAAGCVVASRLSEDPSVRVCLLEAGGPDTSVLIHAPMGFAVTAPLKMHNWNYQTVPQPGFKGRRGYQPRG